MFGLEVQLQAGCDYPPSNSLSTQALQPPSSTAESYGLCWLVLAVHLESASRDDHAPYTHTCHIRNIGPQNKRHRNPSEAHSKGQSNNRQRFCPIGGRRGQKRGAHRPVERLNPKLSAPIGGKQVSRRPTSQSSRNLTVLRFRAGVQNLGRQPPPETHRSYKSPVCLQLVMATCKGLRPKPLGSWI